MRWTPARRELSALLIAASGLGCTPRLSAPIGEARDTPPRKGGTLNVATFVHVRSIDPAVAFDEGSEPIVRLVFGRLFHVSRNGQILGDIAESFQASDDGLRLTVRLRPQARFHDGSRVTAHDVKRSFERMLHPETPCPAPSFYDRIRGYDAYRDGKAAALAGVQAVSDDVVTFVLREPDATFLPVLTLGFAAPVCRAAGSTYDASFSLQACGAGPFRLEAWEGQEALRLRRHDAYHAAADVHLDAIHWLFGVMSTAQRFRFERGELDLVHELTAADSVAFRTDARWNDFAAWNRPRTTRGIFMNTEMPPFDRQEVRSAIAHAIDRQAVATLRAGTLVAAHSMVPSGVVGHDPTFQGQRYDPAKALELMQRAGFPYDPSTGTGGYPDTIDYVVPADSFDMQVAEVFQQQLARVGIRIRIKAMAWTASLVVTGRRGAARMGADGWSADFDDASDFLDPLFSTQAIQNEESQNRAFYSNLELDELLRRARRELSADERRKLYRRAEEIIRDDAPWAIVYGYRYFDVWQPYLHGYSTHPHMYLDIANAWLDVEQRKLAFRAKGAPPGSVNALALDLTRRRHR